MRSFALLLLFGATRLVSSQALAAPSQADFLTLLRAQPIVQALRHSLVINGNAEWTAGSQHETGAATLQANADGSSRALLAFNPSMRADDSAALSSRSCLWIDAKGTNHAVKGGNCMMPVAWFAPSISLLLMDSPLVSTTDEGSVTDNGVSLHAIKLHMLSPAADEDMATLVANSSEVTVLFDPSTFVPVLLKYSLHPDGDDVRGIPVRVEFSDFRTVSGVSVPYHIDRYVSRTLQLSVQASSVSIQ